MLTASHIVFKPLPNTLMQMRQCIEYLHLLLLFPMQCGKKHSIPSTSAHCSKPGMPSKNHMLQLQAYKHSTSMIISTPPLMLLHPHNAPLPTQCTSTPILATDVKAAVIDRLVSFNICYKSGACYNPGAKGCSVVGSLQMPAVV
jgi:hypothetical protein